MLANQYACKISGKKMEVIDCGRDITYSTHEMQFARAVADRIIFLEGGKIQEDETPDEFFEHPKTDRAKKFLNTFTFESVKRDI